MCTVAGWGLVSLSRSTNRLHEVQLTVQRDSRCRDRFSFYTGQTQICVGNPSSRKSAFLVRPWASANTACQAGRSKQAIPHGVSLEGSEQREVGSFPINLVSRVTGGALGTQHTRVQCFPGEGKGTLTWVELETVTLARPEAQPWKDRKADFHISTALPSSPHSPLLSLRARP